MKAKVQENMLKARFNGIDLLKKMKINNKITIATENGEGQFDIKKFHKRYETIIDKNFYKNQHYYIFQQLEELKKDLHKEEEIIELYNENYEFYENFEDLVKSKVKKKKDQKWILDFIEVKENISLIKESFDLIKSGGFNKETQNGALLSTIERKQNLIDCLKTKILEAKSVFGELNIISIDRTESFAIRK